MTPKVKARLRLTVVALALVPLGILARMSGSGRLSEFVQRTGARAWTKYDRDAGADVRD